MMSENTGDRSPIV